MDSDLREKLAWCFGSLAFILLVGTLGYWRIEGWSIFDALYMTTITLSTIGYGEVHPLSNAGRAFTIVLILGGLGAVAYSFSAMTALIVEGEITDIWRRKKMESAINALNGHYIVCGAGHSGATILEELAKTRRPFVVIERDEEKAARLKDQKYLALCGDALQDEVLIQAGVRRAAGVFCALAEDQDNAFVAVSARGLNPKVRIISAVHEVGIREKLLRSGADSVVSSGHIGGLRMVSEMVRPQTVSFLDSMIRDDSSIYRFEDVFIPTGSSMIGRPAKTIQNAHGSCLVLAIKDPANSRYDINPPPERPLKEGETLVVLGNIEEIGKLRSQLGN